MLPHVNPGVMDASDLAGLRGSARRGSCWSPPRSVCRRAAGRTSARRTSSGAAARDAAARGRGDRALHHGHPDRDRRNASGADRIAPRDPRARRALRPCAGGDRPELPREAGRGWPGIRSRRSTSCCWTAAAARVLLGPDWNIQAPPNLSYDEFPRLLDAGINDWGGVSPVTVDHVNPEAPWPEVERLRAATEARGLRLAPRLAVYPSTWPTFRAGPIRQSRPPSCAARTPTASPARIAWAAGSAESPASPVCHPGRQPGGHQPPPHCERIQEIRTHGCRKCAETVTTNRRDAGQGARRRRARRGRRHGAPPRPRPRCLTRSSTPPTASAARSTATRHLRGDAEHQLHQRLLLPLRLLRLLEGQAGREPARPPYLVPLDEIVRRSREAWERGAVEVCLQGGIHPAFTGDFYLDVCRAIKDELPDIHVHAFSALEVWQGAATLGVTLGEYLALLARSRARLAAGDRGRDPGRRRAAHDLPGQGLDAAVAPGPR